MSRDRELRCDVAGGMPFDAALDAVVAGSKIVMVERPPQLTGERDEEIADELCCFDPALAHAAGLGPTPDMIGVVCARVSQVNAVRERLPSCLSTTRFQGGLMRRRSISTPVGYACCFPDIASHAGYWGGRASRSN